MLTPAGYGCKYNEGAATAGHKIVVSVALLVDGAVEHRRRHHACSTGGAHPPWSTARLLWHPRYREAAEDREAKHREVDLGSIIHPAWPVG